MIFRSTLTVLIVCMATSLPMDTITAQVQDTAPLLTVEQAVKTGLENNYSIRIANNQSDIAENNVALGNAGFLPTIDAVGSRSFTKENVTQLFLDGSENNVTGATSKSWGGSLEVNYTIFDGLNTFIEYDRLKELNELGEAEARVVIEQNISTIIAQYYNIVSQQKVLEVLRSNMEVSQERIDIAETRLNVGSGSRFDLLQAKTDFNTDKAAVLEQENIVQNTKVDLNRLMGRSVDQPFTIKRDIPVKQNLEYALLKQNAANQNLDLQISRLNKQIANTAIKQIRTEQLPQVDVQFTYDYNDFQSSSGFLQANKSNGFTYLVTGRLNIFDALNKRRRIQNAQIEQKNNQIAIEDQQSIIQAQLEQSYQNYLNALERVELEQQNVDFARQRLDIAIERFRLGSINSIELREAQRTLTDTESRLISARFSAKDAQIQLEQLSGKLINSLNF